MAAESTLTRQFLRTLQISSVIGTGRVVGSGPATNGSFAVNGLGGDNVVKLEEVLFTTMIIYRGINRPVNILNPD